MTYIVIEMQTNGSATAVVPPVTFTDRNEAEARFHNILSFAAVQTVEEHTVVMLTEDGTLVRRECYRHPVEPTPEPTPEPEE